MGWGVWMELERFRAEFPVLEWVCWLFTPSCGPGARRVVEAVRAELAEWDSSSWEERDRPAQHSRRMMAGVLGVSPADVALVQSVAEGASTVAASLPDGSRVVVGDAEYRSVVFPWLAAERRGVRVHQVPMPEGVLRSTALIEAITEDTTLVAVSDVQSSSGARVDLVAVAERCREVGARLFVDATQSAGVLRLPEAVRPDFVAVHGYKWLLCPRGAAWLYVRPDRLEELVPLAPNAHSGPRPWTEYYGGPLEYAQDARRLDMSLCWPSWAGAAVALDLVGALDPVSLEEHCLGLAGMLREGLAELGLKCLPSEVPSHIVSVAVPDADAALSVLREAGIRATARAGALRFGFHGFNTADDVARVLSALRPLAGNGA
ncbi:aminotransferase class V-fold PLP-dependent enzyme [Thermomonospora cellulosilytica]|uniref:Selenocysteine lyase/cysteine desulfurase n=1 Tax=Thermomonospora cellulosilytica TaxID=1411118 RepID=A0A7W3MUM3_9ACTN|nr:aminotransferase class V-fold PLP-dependent enzyme [Thermomonospora cellulosilytica]MBA9002232.1 selenocysteine lyase/cysteine desulfurase [Thermomonospora cellulosilytica]